MSRKNKEGGFEIQYKCTNKHKRVCSDALRACVGDFSLLRGGSIWFCGSCAAYEWKSVHRCLFCRQIFPWSVFTGHVNGGVSSLMRGYYGVVSDDKKTIKIHGFNSRLSDKTLPITCRKHPAASNRPPITARRGHPPATLIVFRRLPKGWNLKT